MALSIFILAIFAADSTPKHGDTILFVGDSITQAGGYVADVEAYILACRPNDYFRVVNVGKSSETVSGTSEPDHHPPRPCIHDRFARDVAAFNPNIVVACYGMNDGNYFPWVEERFEKYKAGMTRFIDRVFKETPARALVLLTPPPFDSKRAPSPPTDGKSFGYKHPSPHYDAVLRKYSDWLLTLKSDRIDVVDVHREMLLEKKIRTQGRDTGFTFSPDAVHPDRSGHWMMAQTLLLHWSIRPSWKELNLDAKESAEPQRAEGDRLTFRTREIHPPLRLLGIGKGFANRTPGHDELFDQPIKLKGEVVRPAGGRLVESSKDARTASNRKKSEIIAFSPLKEGLIDSDIRLSGFGMKVAARRMLISEEWLAAQKDKPFLDERLSMESIENAERKWQAAFDAIDSLRRPRRFQIVVELPNP
jgi:hypothetical protein